MKARIVVAGLLVSMMVVDVSAQRAEYDDMYFRGKDREKNSAIDAEDSFAKTKKQKSDAVALPEEDLSNPTDSYSARNVNPEYVSRSNSEQAGEDESNYYLEGYTPSASSASNFNNSYYNNANLAGSSYYANNGWNSPYYGSCGYCDPFMTPAYGYGPSYGWRTGWSVSMTYGNYWNPYGGYGMYNPYYGGYGNHYYGGYGYPGYYGGGNYYYESPRVVNYGKRPSRHSAVVQPTQRAVTRSRNTIAENVTNVTSGNRTRPRQAQDEYYVRPSRRSSTTSVFTNPSPWNSGNSSRNGSSTPVSTQPTRTRDSYNPPSYTPSSSPSPSRGSSGGSGGSSPRPRGRN
jgi:hypothetical protein